MRLLIIAGALLLLAALLLSAVAYVLLSHTTGQPILGQDRRMRLQAWSREAGLLLLANLFLLPGRVRHRFPSTAEPYPPVPVVLVGGPGPSCGLLPWMTLVLRRRLGNRPVLSFGAPGLPSESPLEAYLTEGLARSGASKVDLVTLGAGALIALPLLEQDSSRLRKLVMLAPPLLGSRMGVFLPGPWGTLLRQRFAEHGGRRRFPEDLRQLRSRRRDLLVLRGEEDAVYQPDETRGPAWLRCEDLKGVGHLGLMVAPTTLTRLLEELSV